MQGVDEKARETHASDEVQVHASNLARTLTEAGYPPQQISVTVAEDGGVVILARLGHRSFQVVAPPAARRLVLPWGRWLIALWFGLLLGFLGLPRIELPQISLPIARSSQTAASLQPEVPTLQSLPSQPTLQSLSSQPTLQSLPSQPTLQSLPSHATLPTPVPAAPHVLFADSLSHPIANWPNDTSGTAWFDNSAYRLFARNPGQFVAIGVPLGRPLGDVKLDAQFRKLDGPAGGGYGLIVRDQSQPALRDGRSQGGQYLVLEVGDRGDIGIWQRDETKWIDILPWTHSEAVNLDRQPNVLAVTTHGSQIHFEVNGKSVADITDDRLPPLGGVGIFAGGDLNEVALESLRIESP